MESMRAGYLAGPSAPNLLRCSDLASGKPVDILFFMGRCDDGSAFLSFPHFVLLTLCCAARFSYRQFQAMSRTIVPGMDLLVHGKIQLPPAPHETPTTSIASSRPSRSGASKPSKAKPAFKLLRAQVRRAMLSCFLVLSFIIIVFVWLFRSLTQRFTSSRVPRIELST